MSIKIMKVTLLPISFETVKPFVYFAFAGDDDLLRTYHTSPGDLDHCVDNTMEFIRENHKFYQKDIEFYAVTTDEAGVVGFTAVIRNEQTPNELYSFGINIKYRTKEVVTGWLEEVEKLLGKFFIVLWSKNTRAIEFFERNGLKVDRERKYLNDETKTFITCRRVELLQD